MLIMFHFERFGTFVLINVAVIENGKQSTIQTEKNRVGLLSVECLSASAILLHSGRNSIRLCKSKIKRRNCNLWKEIKITDE